MTTNINCKDLGVHDCDYMASGEAPIDALEDMLEHLRSEHDLDMPDAELILSGEDLEENALEVEPDVVVIVKRLRERLEVGQSEVLGDQPNPAIGKVTS